MIKYDHHVWRKSLHVPNAPKEAETLGDYRITRGEYEVGLLEVVEKANERNEEEVERKHGIPIGSLMSGERCAQQRGKVAHTTRPGKLQTEERSGDREAGQP